MVGGSEKTHYRVSPVAMFFMVMFALVVDLLQFLLTIFVVTIPLAWLLSAFAAIALALWFLVLGVNYFKGKRAGLKMAASLSAAVAEFVPVINAIPATTLGVVVVILISRLEDWESAKEQQAGNWQVVSQRAAEQEAQMQAFAARRAANDNADEDYAQAA